MVRGRVDEGIAEIKRALELDPLSLSANIYLGLFLLRAGRTAEAKEQFEKTLELDPNHLLTRWLIGQVLILELKYEEGVREIEKAVELSRANPMELAGLGWAYAISGRKNEAQRVLKELEERAKQEYVRPYLYAKIHNALGEREKALEWLEKSYEEHDVSLVTMAGDETLASWRSEPRFILILKKLNLEE